MEAAEMRGKQANRPEGFPEWRPSDKGAGIEMRTPVTLYQKSGRKKKELGTIMMPTEEVAAAKNQGEVLAKAISAYDVLKRALL
jgi:hypothetical protein